MGAGARGEAEDELGTTAALCGLPASNSLLPSPTGLGSGRAFQTQMQQIPSHCLRAPPDLTGLPLLSEGAGVTHCDHDSQLPAPT